MKRELIRTEDPTDRYFQLDAIPGMMENFRNTCRTWRNNTNEGLGITTP